MPQMLKFSKIKSDLNDAIANLQQLESLANAPQDRFDAEQAQQLQHSTTMLLSELEQLPGEQIPRLQRQRQRKRQKRKKHGRIQKAFHRAAAERSKVETMPQQSPTLPAAAASLQQKQHMRLKMHRDAKTMLHTFDLLEKLYVARGGDQAGIHPQLAHMRQVWRRVQLENEGQEGEATQNLEAQWEEVLFGSSQSHGCGGKKNTREFLQRRAIWDSYISSGKKGTCIPIGWVLPPAEATSEWTAYRME